MITIIDFREVAGTFWVAYTPPLIRRGDYADRPVQVSGPIHIMTIDEVGQYLGGN